MLTEARDSIVRFYVTRRPYHYGCTPFDLLLTSKDRFKIFDWVLRFLDFAPQTPFFRSQHHTSRRHRRPLRDRDRDHLKATAAATGDPQNGKDED